MSNVAAFFSIEFVIACFCTGYVLTCAQTRTHTRTYAHTLINTRKHTCHVYHSSRQFLEEASSICFQCIKTGINCMMLYLCFWLASYSLFFFVNISWWISFFFLRFSLSVCRSLHAHVIQLVKEQLGKRGVQAADNIFRNQLRFLATVAGLPEIRIFVAEKFEQWIQNPKASSICSFVSTCCSCTLKQNIAAARAMFVTVVSFFVPTSCFLSR